MLARIREGTLLLNSREEYERLLDLYPKKASLHRALADFLVKQGDQPNAIMSYEKASERYLETRRSLQAIVATILAWSIAKPTHEQGRVFHAAIQGSIKSSPEGVVMVYTVDYAIWQVGPDLNVIGAACCKNDIAQVYY